MGDGEHMTKTLFLAGLLLLGNGCRFYTMNMNKPPKRWATVLDADTEAPLGGVPLAYSDTKKPYFIVSTVVESRTYVSGPDGRVHLPRDVKLHAAWASGYEIDSFRHPYPPPKNADVYYVRTRESYMKLMEEQIQKETNR